jgi:hypothetical protein
VNRSVSCEIRSFVGAGSRSCRWFLVARGRRLLEPHSMRGPLCAICRCSPAGLASRTMRFSCPGRLSQRNSPARWTRRRPDWSAPMVIVAGHITVEPQKRESYLAAVCASSNRLAGQLAASTSRSARTWSTPDVSTSSSAGSRRRHWRPSAAAALTRKRPAMFTVSVQEYVIADAGRVRGGCGNESAGRTLLRPTRSAPRSARIERRQSPARRGLRQ